MPQLWNVLRGDMSLVGPRPPLPHEVSQYESAERRRLSMRPGLTCLWQVTGRNDIGFDEWVRLDLEYIDSWSLYLDLEDPGANRARGAVRHRRLARRHPARPRGRSPPRRAADSPARLRELTRNQPGSAQRA